MTDANERDPERITEDKFWELFRQGLLSILDALERWRGFKPRTAELRRLMKQRRRGMSG